MLADVFWDALRQGHAGAAREALDGMRGAKDAHRHGAQIERATLALAFRTGDAATLLDMAGRGSAQALVLLTEHLLGSGEPVNAYDALAGALGAPPHSAETRLHTLAGTIAARIANSAGAPQGTKRRYAALAERHLGRAGAEPGDWPPDALREYALLLLASGQGEAARDLLEDALSSRHSESQGASALLLRVLCASAPEDTDAVASALARHVELAHSAGALALDDATLAAVQSLCARLGAQSAALSESHARLSSALHALPRLPES